MKVHQLTADQALKSLASRASGLEHTEARRRLAEFGPNRMEEIRGAPLALRFAGEFVHFFALILWVAAGLAFYAEAHEPGQGMGTMGVAIVGVIVVNGLFSFFQEYRAERALAALRKLLPREVKALRDGVISALPVPSVVGVVASTEMVSDGVRESPPDDPGVGVAKQHPAVRRAQNSRRNGKYCRIGKLEFWSSFFRNSSVRCSSLRKIDWVEYQC